MLVGDFWGEILLVERDGGRRREIKNAGLGTGMAGRIKVLWDQVLLTGGTSSNSGWVRSQFQVLSRPSLRHTDGAQPVVR